MDQTDFLSIDARIRIYTRVLLMQVNTHNCDQAVGDCKCQTAQDFKALTTELGALTRQLSERRKLLVNLPAGNMTPAQAAEFMNRWDGKG